MKNALVLLIFLVSSSILAGQNCSSKLSKAEASKADFLAYSIYTKDYRQKTEEMNKKNDTYLGDFLVDDRILDFRLSVVKSIDSILSVKEATFEANLGMYISCLHRNKIYISKEEALEDLDFYEVEVLKLDKISELLRENSIY